MTEQTSPTSSNKNNTKSSEGSGWLKNQVSSVVVGVIVATIVSVVVIIVQIFFAPMIAKRVKIQESIAEKRYEACEKAINILQKSLASTPWVKAEVPKGYTPPEEGPTQLDLNVVYTLLATYGKSGAIAEEFLKAFGFEKNEDGKLVQAPIDDLDTPTAVGKFVLKLREEMGIEGTGVDPNTFNYIFRKTSKNNN